MMMDATKVNIFDIFEKRQKLASNIRRDVNYTA
jgi:hypothetical protein